MEFLQRGNRQFALFELGEPALQSHDKLAVGGTVRVKRGAIHTVHGVLLVVEMKIRIVHQGVDQPVQTIRGDITMERGIDLVQSGKDLPVLTVDVSMTGFQRWMPFKHTPFIGRQSPILSKDSFTSAT